MIKTNDGHKLKYIENKICDEEVVLFCHGITSSKTEGGFFNDFARYLNKEKISTVQFDFRGHGDSGVKFEEATIPGMILDLNTMINYLTNKYSKISIIAASFGASILLLLEQKKEIRLNKIILLNPVLDYKSTFTDCRSEWSKSFFPRGGIDSLLVNERKILIAGRYRMNPLMALELFFYEPSLKKWQNPIPMLIFHGDKDSIVDISDSVAFVAASNPDYVTLRKLEKSSHGLEENKQSVIEESCKFIKG